MSAREVTEFVIVPPDHKVEVILNSAERFKAYLASEFPGRKFSLQPVAPFDDESFQIIPIMGAIGDKGGVLAAYPSPMLVREIRTACERFDPASTQGWPRSARALRLLNYCDEICPSCGNCDYCHCNRKKRSHLCSGGEAVDPSLQLAEIHS